MSKVLEQEEVELLKELSKILYNVRQEHKKLNNSASILSVARLEFAVHEVLTKNELHKMGEVIDVKTNPEILKIISAKKVLKPTNDHGQVLTTLEKEEELVRGFAKECVKGMDKMSREEKIDHLYHQTVKLLQKQAQFDEFFKLTNGGIAKVEAENKKLKQ